MWHDIFQAYADAMQVAMLQSPTDADRRRRGATFDPSEPAWSFRAPVKQSKQIAPSLKSSSNS